jgi:hypothetical protein
MTAKPTAERIAKMEYRARQLIEVKKGGTVNDLQRWHGWLCNVYYRHHVAIVCHCSESDRQTYTLGVQTSSVKDLIGLLA